MIAEHGVRPGADTHARERLRCPVQEAGEPGSIEVWPVVERVGVVRQLDAVVAAGAAPGSDERPAERRHRLRELVALIVVDQVTALDDGVCSEAADRPHRSGEDLGRERFVGAERRLKRCSEPIQE